MNQRVKLIAAKRLSRRQVLGLAAGGGAAMSLFMTPGGPLLASVFSQNLISKVRGCRTARRRLQNFQKSEDRLTGCLRADQKKRVMLVQRKIDGIAAVMSHVVKSDDELYLKYGALCEVIDQDITGHGAHLDKMISAGYFNWLDQLDQEIVELGAPVSPFWRDHLHPYPKINGVRVLWHQDDHWGGGRFTRYSATA